MTYPTTYLEALRAELSRLEVELVGHARLEEHCVEGPDQKHAARRAADARQRINSIHAEIERLGEDAA